MKTTFNFQINPDDNRKDWDNVTVHTKVITDRPTAIHLAQKVARLFKAEVRLTEGHYPFTTSGSYFHHKRD
nr:hypothetical protein [Pedobacter sp. ASV19]